MGDNIGRESGRWFENVHHSQAKCLFLCFLENAVKLHWKNTKQKLLFRRGQIAILENRSKKTFVEAKISDANIGRVLENVHHSQAKCSFLCFSQKKKIRVTCRKHEGKVVISSRPNALLQKNRPYKSCRSTIWVITHADRSLDQIIKTSESRGFWVGGGHFV